MAARREGKIRSLIVARIGKDEKGKTTFDLKAATKDIAAFVDAVEERAVNRERKRLQEEADQ